MADLVYYRVEQERHGDLDSRKISFEEAKLALEWLAKEYGVKLGWIKKTRGNRTSYYRSSDCGIMLSCGMINGPWRVSWRIVCHEFAHALDHKINREAHTGRHRWHYKGHAEIMDRVTDRVRTRWVTRPTPDRKGTM